MAHHKFLDLKSKELRSIREQLLFEEDLDFINPVHEQEFAIALSQIDIAIHQLKALSLKMEWIK